jgi:hypothetical protein
MTYDGKKKRNEQLSRKEKRLQRHRAALEGLPPDVAVTKAVQMAAAAVHRKELELEKGCKVTRKDRAKLMKEMKAGIDAAACVGLRIKQFDSVPDEMLKTAMTQEQVLIMELVSASDQNASGALVTAQRVSVAAVTAVIAAITQKSSAAPSAVETASECVPAIGDETAKTVEDVRPSVPAVTVEQAVTTLMGRPSSYRPEIGDDLCQWIQSGKSLNRWCKENGIAASTVYKWLRERADFRDSYTRAHGDRADTLVEDMIDIADRAESASDMTTVVALKLMIETRKWIAERMRPDKYGNRLQVEQKGHVTFQLGVPRRSAEVIDVEAK